MRECKKMTNIRYGWFIGPSFCFDSADQENSLISLTVCIAKRGIHMDIDGLEGTRVAEMIYRGRVVFFLKVPFPKIHFSKIYF